MAMQAREIVLQGITPAMHHNVQLADPDNEYAKEISKRTTASRRPGADKEAIRKEICDLEWRGGIYFDEKLGPYMKSETVKAMIVGAAKQFRMGSTVLRSLHVRETRIPLAYDGPRDWDSLYAEFVEEGKWFDRRIVTIGKVKVPRVRPMFEDWALQFTLVFDDRALNDDNLRQFLEIAGLTGMGEARNIGFGRFDVASYKKLSMGGKFKKAA